MTQTSIPGGLAIPILTATGFVVVTTEFVLVGILPLVAGDLAVSVPRAGLLVTLFAFTVALAGPPLTMALGGVERRALFAGIMGVFASANMLAAVAPSIWVLGVARFIPALALPVFWSLAIATASGISGPAHAGRAIARVFVGISAASVIGVPIGTLLADALGWRAMFLAIAGLCIAMGLVIARFFPRTPGERLPLARQVAVLGRPLFLAHLALATASFTAMFTGYTYLAALLHSTGGFGRRATGLILVGFGIAGLLGNWVAGRSAERRPIATTALVTGIVGAATLATGLSFGMDALLFGALALWGAAHAAGFVANTVRVTAAGADAPAFSASLNASVCNVGIGLGAILGGRIIDARSLDAVGPTTAFAAVLALAGCAAVAAWTRGTSRPTRLTSKGPTRVLAIAGRP